MSGGRRLLLWLFAWLGLAASSTSAWVHFRLLQDPTYTSFCDVSATVSCTQAYQSAYGYLAGIPVAVLGAVFFVGVLALLLAQASARPEVSEGIPGYVFAASTIGLAFVLYLAYGAFFVLKAICLLCVLTYIAVVGLVVVSGAAASLPMTTLPRRALRDLGIALRNPLALTVLVVLLAGAGSAIAFFPREPLAGASATAAQAASGAQAQPAQDQVQALLQWFEQQPKAIVPVDPGGAKVLIVKFNDYQCPPCRRSYEDYKPILARYEAASPGKVRFVTKDYPLDPECNQNAPNGAHTNACEAAVAVRLAREHGKAEAMEEWLFSNQATLTQIGIKAATRDVGGVQDYDARYAQVLEQVKSDTALGGLLGVRSTPTFFINGTKVEGGLAPQWFDALLAAELKKAGQ